MVVSPEAQSGVSQLRRGVFQFCVLALLRDGEKYAYELVRELCDAHGLSTSEGTIYPLLARLRKEGWVASLTRESTVGPPRRYYTLTPRGGRALEEFTADWSSFRTAVDQLLQTQESTRDLHLKKTD
ncbi:PadR family transcriptional regulator [Streptomyces sp. VNUA24]|uniref:PadR family transcriptional regulator n=1 Tax=Streptomyces sp. VNUA24 TaxID=3031131 RepID=UPI0023B875F1|nr:PadR family transcriptional regulator [Streptomyces sp. VNUA24]WEH16394.1 PadR family transcriptional regulator [Streptomyces sp. VNUA24]